MRPRRVGRRLLAAAAGLVALALLAPSAAPALDSDLKGSAIFNLEGENGYRIVVLASSERADGRGDVALIVFRRSATVVYGAPATVTPTRFDADLGELGRIALDVVPTGARKTLRPRCGGDPVTLEPDSYRGSFEFRGEEGFTAATATRIPEFSRFSVDFGCGGRVTGEAGGPGLPGARLRALAGRGHRRTVLQVNQNRPGARPFFEAEVAEKRGRIEINRYLSGRTRADAFDFDPLLRTATFAPPPPFSGRATFRRDATPGKRWSGSLEADFPGRSNVPLVVPGSRVSLVHARLTRG